jgi:uncharacterized protein (TIGR03086 family)
VARPGTVGRVGEGRQRYREALDIFGGVVDGVEDTAWAGPSPCDGWSAAAVVGHVIHGSRIILAMATGEPPVPPAGDPAAVAGEDPARAWHTRRAEIEQILDSLDLDARVETAQGVLRVDDGLGQAVIEPLVHAWDLAAATGRDLRLPDHLVTPLLAGLERIDGLLRTGGMFADRLQVPSDAPEQQRLLALLGRRC